MPRKDHARSRAQSARAAYDKYVKNNDPLAYDKYVSFQEDKYVIFQEIVEATENVASWSDRRVALIRAAKEAGHSLTLLAAIAGVSRQALDDPPYTD